MKINRLSSGFTLIELVTVILVLSIVSVGVGSYITFGVDIYRDAIGRDRQINESRFVIERLSRELRAALPNSIRVKDSCIEFVPITASSSYIAAPIVPQQSNKVMVVATNNMVLNKLVIYPLSPGDIYRDPTGTIGKVFNVDSKVSGGTNIVELTLTNTVSFTQQAPSQRYFLIENAVSYCADGDKIKRYAGYWPQGAQQAPTPLANGILMAQYQANPNPFVYHQDNLVRNAVVQIDFKFNYNDESLALYHEVHIVNVP